MPRVVHELNKAFFECHQHMGYIDVEIWAAKAFYIGARVQQRDFEIT